MVVDIDKINLGDMTEEDLRELDIRIHTEVDKRQQVKVDSAINSFKKAFENLLQYVDIFYDDEEDTGYYADLRDFNKFKFE